MISEARVDVHGDHSVVFVTPNSRFPMIRVDGAWKLDVGEYARGQHLPALELAFGYEQMAATYVRVMQDIQAGKITSAAEARRALGTLAGADNAPPVPDGVPAEQANPMAALRAFLAATSAADFDRALQLCDIHGKGEESLARALVSLHVSRNVCLTLATQKFGAEAARAILPPFNADSAAGDFPVNGERVEILIGRTPFRLVRVQGRWKIWIGGWCRNDPRMAAPTAEAFRMLTERYIEAGDRLRAGKFASANELDKFLNQRAAAK